jgi:hypothetical protein
MLSSPGFGPETITGDYSYQWRRAVVIDAQGDTLTDFQTEPVIWDFVYYVPDTASHPGGQSARLMEYVGAGVICYLPAEGILASTTGWTPEIVLRDLNGIPRRIIHISLEAEPITLEMRSRIRTIWEEIYASSLDDPSVRAEMSGMKFLDRKAFWSGMEIDDYGWYWLRIPELNTRKLGGVSYRILSPEGEYLGDSRRPFGGSDTLHKGRCLTMCIDPDTGEPQVTVYRIIPAVDGLSYP